MKSLKRIICFMLCATLVIAPYAFKTNGDEEIQKNSEVKKVLFIGK